MLARRTGKDFKEQAKQDDKHIKRFATGPRRKEMVLAETAAYLMRRKKALANSALRFAPISSRPMAMALGAMAARRQCTQSLAINRHPKSAERSSGSSTAYLMAACRQTR